MIGANVLYFYDSTGIQATMKFFSICLSTLLILCSSILAPIATAADTAQVKRTIIYPSPLTQFDKRAEYPSELLALALSKMNSHYQLKPSQTPVKQKRALFNLKNQNQMNVVWSMTSTERESQLRLIRIPIYKGLIGWRIGLIQSSQQPLFSHNMPLQSFQTVRILQGHDWPDTKILKKNGFKVTTASSYSALFKMLKNDRGSYFPRSIVEIWAEAEAQRTNGLAVEQNFLLKYPTAFYYFVHPSDIELAETIEQGLEIAIKDGSFDALFQKYHGDLIQKANLEQRIIIELDNPILPKLTPLSRKELWFSLNKQPVSR